MSVRHRAKKMILLLAGVVLAVVLVGQIAGADSDCHNNYPKNSPPPSPAPKGLLAKVAWKQASIFADAKYSSGKFNYQLCLPGRPN